METRYSSAGKVQPIEGKNLIEPGTCLTCSKPCYDPSEIWANPGVEIEHYGMVYICLDCCAELADFINFKSPKAYRDLDEKYKALHKDWNILRSQLAEAKGLLDARITSAGSSEPSGNGSADVALSKVESDAGFLDSVLNDDEPEPVKSGA